MQYNLPVDTKRKYLRVVESAILCLQHSFRFREINPTSNQTKITNLFSRKRTSSAMHELSIHEFLANDKIPFPWLLFQKYEIIPTNSIFRIIYEIPISIKIFQQYLLPTTIL